MPTTKCSSNSLAEIWLTCTGHACSNTFRPMRSAISGRLPAARATASRSATDAGCAGASPGHAASEKTNVSTSLVRLRKIRPHDGRLAAGDAGPRAVELVQHARRRAGSRFDLRFALRTLAPRDVDHSRAIGAGLEERGALLHARRVRFQKRFRLCEERTLDFLQQRWKRLYQTFERHARALVGVALGAVAPHHHGGSRVDVAGTDLDSNRHAAQIPFTVLPPRRFVARIDAHAPPGLGQSVGGLTSDADRTIVVGPHDWNEDGFDRRILGGTRKPRSSPWVMIIPPSIRHDMPHD